MKSYAIGIDLGTTNCALSYLDLGATKGRGAQEGLLGIPQLTAAGVVEAKPLLPSFLYLAGQQEFPAGSLALPWDPQPQAVVGEFARRHGANVPGRLVSSAKSWLCHAGVDRRGAILPAQSSADLQRISPLEASTRTLSHLKQAWDAAHPEAPFAQQEVVVTVPASFDASARELTLEAARQAAYPTPTLVEEPQAAFYAWVEQAGESFRKQTRPGDVILVVNVGGGTSDFSIISDKEGDLELTRLAVGEHILLGGDNMDLALAYAVAQRLAATGKKLDAWQMTALTHACRQAKELLYADSALASAPLVIPGRSSSLIGGTLRSELSRAELDRVLTDGFFPKVAVSEAPQSARRSGLAQLGLPYAQDAGVTRHLAAFLTRQARSLEAADGGGATPVGASFIRPTAILFNGGVFKAAPLKQRVLDVINFWLQADGAPAARELAGAQLDVAVARGAAYYAWVRRGHGLRIRGGTAHAYYIGLESSMPAVPGIEPPINALCVAPFGMEEGSRAEVSPQEFGLLVGEPVRFRFFSSSTRRTDRVGDLIEDPSTGEDFEEVAPIETELPAGAAPAGVPVPVRLQATVTELGMLELHCVAREGAGNWKLELNVRMKE